MNKQYSKRGATTIFLAIILTALILVECTYMIIVADLNHRLTFARAVRNQTESVLAEYDRELFRTYGLYAFKTDTIDDSVFVNTLEASGLQNNSTLIVDGVNTWTTDDLRHAITVFYTYRSSSIIVNMVLDTIMSFVAQNDELDFLDNIRDFMESDAAEYLGDIISGTADIAEKLENLAEYCHIENLSGKLREFNTFMDEMDDLWGDTLNGNNSFDPSDMSFVENSLSAAQNLADFNTSVNDVLFHPLAAHYATYNFDSNLTDDKTINGTEFTDIHEENISDVEYILTGISGTAGVLLACTFIYSILFIRCVVNIYTDSETMSVITGIAEVLDAVVSFVTDGVVTLAPEIYEAVIVAMMAAKYAGLDLLCVKQGETVSFYSVDGIDFLEFGYRDFLFVFMNMVPDSILLDRMNDVLSRDYPDYSVSLTLSSSYRGDNYTYSRGYYLYE